MPLHVERTSGSVGNESVMEGLTFPILSRLASFITVADPGFPIGGALSHWGGHQPLTWVLFGENVMYLSDIKSYVSIRAACASVQVACVSI